MERRREPRIPCNQPARVTLLQSDESFDALLVNVSGRGARILLDRTLPLNTPVRIEAGEIFLLGDICYCRPDESRFSAGVALSHCIFEMSALAHLMQRLTSDQAVDPVKNAHHKHR